MRLTFQNWQNRIIPLLWRRIWVKVLKTKRQGQRTQADSDLRMLSRTLHVIETEHPRGFLCFVRTVFIVKKKVDLLIVAIDFIDFVF